MSLLHRQLHGWRLTTAEILYFLPDHPSLLQSFVWQALDRAPDFPSLARFLNFWERRLDGRLHSVRVAANPMIAAPEIRLVRDGGRLH
jgi:uncharacterized protein Usg